MATNCTIIVFRAIKTFLLTSDSCKILYTQLIASPCFECTLFQDRKRNHNKFHSIFRAACRIQNCSSELTFSFFQCSSRRKAEFKSCQTLTMTAQTLQPSKASHRSCQGNIFNCGLVINRAL